MEDKELDQNAEDQSVIEEAKGEAPFEEIKDETPFEEIKEEPKEESVVEESKEEPVVEEPKEEPVVEEPKEEPVTGVPVAEAVVDAPKDNTKQKKKNGILILVGIVIFILMIVGVLVAVLVPSFLKHDEGKKIETEKNTVSSAYRLSGNGLENFDLYFLQLENKKANMVYSPLSIKYALAMLNEGTDGDSHKQIEAIIGDYKAKRYNNNEHMSFANAMFIRNTYKDRIKEDYTNKLQDSYGAEVITDPFENASPMNSWVRNKTFNLIDGLVTDEKVQQEEFVLINALAIDMNWVNRIQSASAPLPEGMGQKYYHVTYAHEKYNDKQYVASVESIQNEDYPEMTFNNNEGKKSVKIGASFNRYDIIKDLGEDNIRKTVGDAYEAWVNESGYDCGPKDEYVDGYIETLGSNYTREDISTDFYLYVDDDVKAFAKDLQQYDGTTLQYVAIMPTKVSLTEYVKDMNAEGTNKIINNLKFTKIDNFKEGVVTKVTGQIPLFKYEAELDVMGDLKKLGITDVFSIDKADLSKMLKDDEKLYIDNAAHKAMIEFSNDGIKAAAATSMGGAGAAGCGFDYLYEIPVEEIDITMDKPFVYIIRDKDTGEVWFTGTVYEPINK